MNKNEIMSHVFSELGVKKRVNDGFLVFLHKEKKKTCA